MISLKEITADNWVEAIKLTVKKEQENFVASNAVSIAQSKFQPFIECFGIYTDETMVGFSALAKNPEDGTAWIVRHMIGENFQGKGYGKEGLKALIKMMEKKYSCTEIFLDVASDNEVASKLYKKAGFKETGKKHDESPILKLNLDEYSENY
ncbi:MAG TPA: GNAT family N-acetyltransferase [candidate division Zixibacteria bacterium]|nr:GNAT family N-acetyltransferase [candidate division Zixibacteria bacterium]